MIGPDIEQEMQGSGEGSKRKNPDERFLTDPKSKTKAIHAFCFQCMGRDEGYRKHIRDCTSKNCPLYSFRPYK